MDEPDDTSLLRQYVEQHSETAFAALVNRHLNTVYSTALRHTRNPHQAEEISHAVFVILARKAASLRPGVILAGWLHETARLTAMTLLRSERRRIQREQEALMQSETPQNESQLWPQIEPELDTAISSLRESDRNAVLLRFFAGKSLREIAAELQISEDAAKMRIHRALDQLRRFFARRGILATAALFGSAMTSRAAQTAPEAVRFGASAAAIQAANAPSTPLVAASLRALFWNSLRVPLVIFATGALTLVVVGSLQFLQLHPELFIRVHRFFLP